MWAIFKTVFIIMVSCNIFILGKHSLVGYLPWDIFVICFKYNLLFLNEYWIKLSRYVHHFSDAFLLHLTSDCLIKLNSIIMH